MVTVKKSTSKANAVSSRQKAKWALPQGKSSKSEAVLSLLRRKHGASLEEMEKVSGWQKHSVRGYLSGTVKKRLGLKLTSAKDGDGERRYSIPAV